MADIVDSLRFLKISQCSRGVELEQAERIFLPSGVGNRVITVEKRFLMSTRFQKCSAGSILLYSVAVSWQLSGVFLVFALLRLRSVRGNPVAVVSGQSGVCRLDSSRVRLSSLVFGLF